MELWFTKNPKRLLDERDAILDLLNEAPWLICADWDVDNTKSRMHVDAELVVRGHTYSIRLCYPSFFPHVPPSVAPISQDELWSSHQYGSGGALCLEWGPDNWQPQVTGADMLKSTYRLLEIENPKGTERHVHAPSRHRLTLGQSLRSNYGRFILRDGLLHFIFRQQLGSLGRLRFTDLWQKSSLTLIPHAAESFCTLIPHAAESFDGQNWNDPSVPDALGSDKGKPPPGQGLYWIANMPSSRIKELKCVSDLNEVLSTSGAPYDSITVVLKRLYDCIPLTFVLVLTDSQGGLHAFFAIGNDDDSILWNLALVPLDDSVDTVERTPAALRELKDKRVGVVGLGSLGSKIAVSLTRMGMRRFFLIDEDVLLPENIQRHSLNWKSVGAHKTDAVAQELNLIAADMEVEGSNVNVTGQESSVRLNQALDKLGACDLVIDATAEPEVFNVLAAVARTYEKPLLWTTVFAGAIGGMIARSRPKYDPSPASMRAAYLGFIENNPYEDLLPKHNYAAIDDEGRVVTASDAGVGIIAHHAASFAADTVLACEPSAYPYSVYLIGLARGWIFREPFHTVPIDTSSLSLQSRGSITVTDEVVKEAFNFVSGLITATTPPAREIAALGDTEEEGL